MLETSQPSLRQEQHPLIHRLAERILNYWQKYLQLARRIGLCGRKAGRRKITD
jgi:hypothetical protein